MKRSFIVHSFISSALGLATGTLLVQAIENSSISYGVYTLMVAIAAILNIACDQDK